jgi:hypothetical protein
MIWIQIRDVHAEHAQLAEAGVPVVREPASLRIRQTVDGAVLYPSPVSSPWMRRYPQVGFSRAISSTSARMAEAVRGPPRSAAWIGPVPPHQAGVPAQQRPGRDDQAQLAELAAGQQPGQRGQDRAVSPGQLRGFNLALEHGHLVAQGQDLGVLGAAGSGEQGKPSEYPEHRKVSES